jgi:hypothetical protein
VTVALPPVVASLEVTDVLVRRVDFPRGVSVTWLKGRASPASIDEHFRGAGFGQLLDVGGNPPTQVLSSIGNGELSPDWRPRSTGTAVMYLKSDESQIETFLWDDGDVMIRILERRS